MSNHQSIAFCVLTLNEERDLPRCLEAIPNSSQIFVIDSGSTDATKDIAIQNGARVIERLWTGFVDQRNFAVSSLSDRFEWIFFLDADEVMPNRLYSEIVQTIANNPPIDVYWVPSILFFQGKPLRFAPGYPIYHPRLVRTSVPPFSTNHQGHGESVISGLRQDNLMECYDHYFFDGDVIPWMSKHINLATKELSRAPRGQVNYTIRARISSLFKVGFMRATLRFVFHYLIKEGFRDGKIGLRYSQLYFWYEITKATMAAYEK